MKELVKETLHFTLFEHESLRTDKGTHKLSPRQLKDLQKFYGNNGVPYFNLIHNGVRFNAYVGALQIGNTVIEILPKADKSNDSKNWRNILISMLHATGTFDTQAPSKSNLKMLSNSILEHYFELFASEIEYLLQRGLIKKYRQAEGNKNVLTGSIQFAKNIKNNLVHQERFYIKYSSYDNNHDIHAILYKAIRLLNQINTRPKLKSRLGILLMRFPELNDTNISHAVFNKISYTRKTEPYRNALEIAKLILLNYHPDVSKGTNNVLALMFDMNLLWEQFVNVSLRKYKTNYTTIDAQNTKYFWKPTFGQHSKIRPDLVINKNLKDCIVLDTKWKNLNGKNPSPEDLRQMFVYMKFYKAKKVALIYPGIETMQHQGTYFDHNSDHNSILSVEECSIITIGVDKEINKWQKQIAQIVNEWGT